MCDRTLAGQSRRGTAKARSASRARRNYVLGLLNGIVGQVAVSFLHPELVLVGMVWAFSEPVLGRSATMFLVSLVTVVSKAGMLGPQLLVGSVLEHRPRKKPTYVAALAVRGLGYLLIIAAIYLLGKGVTSIGSGLALFYLAYLLVCICTGSGHVIYTDMVGRIIPIKGMGRFLGTRNFWGGALAVVAGLAVIHPILGEVEPPANYLILIAVGSVLSLAAMGLFALTHEEDGPRAKRRTTLAESLRRGLDWLKTDHNYRCYLWMRVAFRTSYLGLAFFIPYGAERLRPDSGPAEVAVLVGIMVATERFSRVLAAAVWGKVADRREFRTCLVGAGVGFLLLPALALGAPLLPKAFEVAIPFTKAVMDLPLCVYLLALAAWGASVQGSIIGGQRFLIGSAPPHRRISYTGFLNTVTSPLTLLPIAGAALAAAFGTQTVFWVVAGGAVLYLVNALRMIPEKKAMAGRDEAVIDEFYVGGA